MDSILKSYEYSLMLEHQELMNQFDIDSFKRNCRATMEGVFSGQSITSSIVSATLDKYDRYINQSLETLQNVSVDKDKMEEFFSKTYNSPLLNEMPLTTPVSDISKVEKIRPQYLEQISTDMVNVINRIFKGTIDKTEIKKYCDSDYATRIKRQSVKTTLPISQKPSDMIKTSRTIVQINNEFLSTTLLPFLRSLPQLIKEMEVTAMNTLGLINSVMGQLNDYVKTAEDLKTEKNLSADECRKLDYYLYNITRIAFDCCSYISCMLIHRITSITFNVVSYNELYTKILNYFPEGERVIHESVMDGSFKDIDDGIVVQHILNGDPSTLLEICNAIIRKQRSDLAYLTGIEIGDDLHSKIDEELEDYTYDMAPYHNFIQMVKQISESLDILSTNAKDPEMIFDDILKKSGLESSLSIRFKEIIPTISNVENYHTTLAKSNDTETIQDAAMTALKELQDFNGHVETITQMIMSVNYKIRDMKVSLRDNINSEYKNQKTLDELTKFMEDFEVDYRQFILTGVHALLSRLEGLRHVLDEVDHDLIDDGNKDVQFSQIENLKDENDYYEEAEDNIMDIDEMVMQHTFESMLMEYNAIRAFKDRGVRIIYEEGENDTATKVIDKSTDQQKEANQSTVNNSNENNQTSPKVGKQTAQDLVERVKTFFQNIMKKFRDKLSEQKDPNNEKNNLTWLSDNKEALLSRGYQGIEVWILPYSNVSAESILNEINAVNKRVGMLNNSTINQYKTKDALKNFLFDFLGNNNGASLGQALTQHCKTGTAPLKTVRLANAQLKGEVPKMIEYSENYYNSYAENIARALETLGKTTEQKISQLTVVTESVMLEAPSDAKTVTIKADGEKTNGNPSITKAQWLSALTQEYSGIVLNSIRDRNFDYLKVLSGLVPKNAKQNNTESNKGQNNQEQKENQNTQSQEQNQNEEK